MFVKTSNAPLVLVKEIVHFFLPEKLVTERLPLGQLLVVQYRQYMLIDQPMQCSVGLIICQNPVINILRSCNPYQHLKEFVAKQGGLLIPTFRMLIEISRSERALKHSLRDVLIVHLGHTTELEELIMIHLRRVTTVRYNAHPDLLELRKVQGRCQCSNAWQDVVTRHQLCQIRRGQRHGVLARAKQGAP